MTYGRSSEEPQEQRRVVLTGGPSAGKTATLEIVRQSFGKHVLVLPESAGILFGGGFPRDGNLAVRRAAQRAIFYTQRELEATGEVSEASIVLCDRGTVDGEAYWPGPEPFWDSVGTTREEQLRRYDAVIHLRTPWPKGYDWSNPLRIETPEEAVALDERILRAWEGHPRRFVVEAEPDFLAKVARALRILGGELPPSCRHLLPDMEHHVRSRPGSGP